MYGRRKRPRPVSVGSARGDYVLRSETVNDPDEARAIVGMGPTASSPTPPM